MYEEGSPRQRECVRGVLRKEISIPLNIASVEDISSLYGGFVSALAKELHSRGACLCGRKGLTFAAATCLPAGSHT